MCAERSVGTAKQTLRTQITRVLKCSEDTGIFDICSQKYKHEYLPRSKTLIPNLYKSNQV